MAEISVIWLLCLGVFMVVLSSGVLAASQWQNFSAVGQYGILLTYTLAFAVASIWTGRQPALQLTAQMLQLATLLIIPVNFWMMDGLQLWRSTIGLGVCLLSGLLLSGMTRQQFSRLLTGFPPIIQRYLVLNSFLLNGLHWGWSIPGFPIAATYIGTISTAWLIYRVTQTFTSASTSAFSPSPAFSSPTDIDRTSESPLQITPVRSAPSFPLLPLSLIISAVLLLMGRAILAAAVPLSDLGLAVGICGWLFCWLGRLEYRQRIPWGMLGGGLLAIGWVACIGSDPPIQALAISGLALWIEGDRLWRAQHNSHQRDGQSNYQISHPIDEQINIQGGSQSYISSNYIHHQAAIDLISSLVIGLQTYSLLWRLIPAATRHGILTVADAWFGDAGLPIALLGVAGLPYLWLMLGVGAFWQQQGQTRFVKLTERCAIGLGAILILFSWANPWLRFLTLTGVALTFLQQHILPRQRRALGWIYLCHGLLLAAVISGIAAFWPDLAGLTWAQILLGLMAIEWGMSLGQSAWQQSGWPFGLGLSGLSYALLFAMMAPSVSNPSGEADLSAALVWLVTPALLTGLAMRYRRTAVELSSGGLFALLFLLHSRSSWLLAAGVAVGLMAINTWIFYRDRPSNSGRLMRPIGAAAITIGWGLGLEILAFWQFGSDWLSFDRSIILFAIHLWILWLIWERTGKPQPGEPDGQWAEDAALSLSSCYGVAANSWAIGLNFISLSCLSLYAITHYVFPVFWPISGWLIGGLILLGSAIGYRLWQAETEWCYYSGAWAIGILVGLLVSWTNLAGTESIAVLQRLALGMLGLGLASQLAGDWAVRRSGLYRSSWHGIPLIYGGLGLAVTSQTWSPMTGLYTLAAALIACGVGSRSPALKPLTGLGLLLRSIGLYAGLLYFLRQSQGEPGDGWAILAGLAIGIAAVDRCGQKWLLPYLRLNALTLRQVAHCHWLLGSSLVILSPLGGLSDQGAVIGLGILAVSAGYALMQGRTHQPGTAPQQAGWIYAGLTEVLLGLAYGLDRWIPDASWLLSWAGSLAVGVGLLLYFLPWNRWGWIQTPWCRMAILLPGTVTLLTLTQISLQSLLIGATFYAWIAKTEVRPRLSYLSLFLFDWAVVRFLLAQSLLTLPWLGLLLSGSLLFVVQIDPGLQSATAKEKRHGLRFLAVLLLSVTLFYQAELEADPALLIRLLTLGWAMGLILAGLGLRMRAFLYGGTLTFVGQVMRILGLFIWTEALLLWAIGIMIGLSLIWIAATFEARRSQVNALMQYWLNELEDWE
jgi:hypothetical protein